MNWKKNDKIQLSIEDMSSTGEGIGKTDGFAWFVKDAIIGDKIEANVMKVKKNYGFARLLRIIKPSVHRVEAPCPVARQCGGCQLQVMEYSEQLRYKENKVWNNLKRIGGLDYLVRAEDGASGGIEIAAETAGGIAIAGGDAKGAAAELACAEQAEAALFYPIIGMEQPWRYRNKAQFPFGRNKEGRIITGFYAGRTHDIIETDDCLLGVKENRLILECIKAHMEKYDISPYNEISHTGLVRHALIRKGFQTGELMVCLVINGVPKDFSHIQELVDALCRIEGMTSISFSINREKTNVIMGSEIVTLYGPGYITDSIGNVQYRISPLSFYQVNPAQTEKLYGTALEYAGLTGNETVWDLYCGIGTISLFLAQQAKQVYGVEIVPQAIEDARENARLNSIDNVGFFVGKAEEVLPEQYEKNHIYADVIVVDPPRKGCDEVCLDTIVKMAPRKVVYVSCDSATLARDVKYLGENGYRVRKVRCVDMFGGGGHVETVVMMSRVNSNK